MKITPDMAWDMAVMYQAGVPLNKIAPRYGLSSAGVLYHLHRQGVPTRGRGSRSPWVAIANRVKRVRDLEVIAADKVERQHQTCRECGREYAKDRHTILCGAKRCRQQREYHNRLADPVRAAKFREYARAAYMRRVEQTRLAERSA